MAKVLLVEDDNNLREIYQARLTAEGYDIVTAQNGEEALVVAKQNKPDLVISDVMMPRISGFEMLDILRNTDGIKHTRVIMLTALGQADDQKRAEGLGADRYLVKSQVTLEDIVNAAKQLLTEDGSVPAAPAPDPAAAPTSTPAADSAASTSVTPTIVDTPVQMAPEPAPAPDPAASAATPATPTPAPSTSAPTGAVTNPPSNPDPIAPAVPAPVASPAEPAPESASPVPVPEPAAVPAPVPEPVATEPTTPALTEENQTPTGPTTPATPPAAESVDNAAQGLEAEEAALQAQIASYSNNDAPAPPAQDSGATSADSASNDQAIADAVKQLNASASAPTPATPPSAAADAATSQQTDAPAPAPEPKSEPSPESTPAPAPASDKPGDAVTVAGKKIIQPISDPAVKKPDLNALLAKEEAKNIIETPPAAPIVDGQAKPAPVQPPASGAPGQAFDPNTSL